MISKKQQNATEKQTAAGRICAATSVTAAAGRLLTRLARLPRLPLALATNAERVDGCALADRHVVPAGSSSDD